MKIPDSIIQEIYSKLDIVEVISDFVELKKDGFNYKGLSPFQDEKTPSFVVSPQKQIFKCFSSGIGGNAIGFLIKSQGMNYREAMEHLAKKYGIEITEGNDEEYQKRKDQLSRNAANADLYHKNLRSYSDTRGIIYTSSRGITDQGINAFQLGFQENKLVFPIHSPLGDVLGFSIRKTDDSPGPKYMNPPESPLYQKSKILYGMYQAKEAILRLDECILVEGYLDVIIPFQHGIKNVVGSCGTAFTADQARLIKRYTREVVVMYDGDAAGQKAIKTVIEILLSENMHPAVLKLPEGEDPGSFVKDKETFSEFSHTKMKWTEWMIQYMNSSVQDPNTPAHKAKIVTEIASLVAKIPDEIERHFYREELSNFFNLPITLSEDGKISIAPAAEANPELSPDESEAQQNTGDTETSPEPGNSRSNTQPEFQLKKKRTWEAYQNILDTLGLNPSPDFIQTHSSGIEIHYFEYDGNPFQIINNRKREPALRRTESLERKPNAVYIPPALRHDGKRWNPALPLFLVEDEISAYLLSECGIPALGINNPTGFLKQKGQKDPHRLISQILQIHAFSGLVYVISNNAFLLPPGDSSATFPYEFHNIAANAESGVETLCLLQETFRKINVDILYPVRDEIYMTDSPYWIDQILLDIGPLPYHWKDIYGEFIDPEDGLFQYQRHIGNKTQYVFEEYLYVNEVNAFLRFHGIDQIGRRFQFRKNIYEYDYRTGVASITGDSEDVQEVWNFNGAYYARERGGQRRISNFVMKCILEVKGLESFGLYEVKGRNGSKANLRLDESDFINISEFKLKIRSLPGEYTYYGSSTQAQQIQEQIIVGVKKGRSLSRALGLYKPKQHAGEIARSSFYVWGNGILSLEDGTFKEASEEGLVEHEGILYYLEAFSSYTVSDDPDDDYQYERQFIYKESAVDFKNWLRQFMQVHGINGHVGFSFLLLALYRDIFQSKFRRTPFLALMGPRGAGKGMLLDSLAAFFGDLVKFNMQTNSSVYAFNDHVSRYTNALCILNEFNPSQLSDYFVNSPKAWYDGESRRKGSVSKPGKTTAETPRSAQIFAGQESYYEYEAAVSRGIICEFQKTKYSIDETLQANRLNDIEAEGIGYITADLLLHRKLVLANFESMHESLQIQLRELCADPSIDARLFFNWASILCVLLIFIEHGVIEYHMTREDIIRHAARRIREQARKMEKEGTLSLFLNYIASEYGTSHGLDHQDVFVHKGELRIRFSRTYTKFEGWLKRYGRNVESAKKDDIYRKLLEHPAFMEEKNGGVWIGYRKNEFGRIKFDGTDSPKAIMSKSSGLIFNYEKMGIELPEIDWLSENDIPKEETPEETISF